VHVQADEDPAVLRRHTRDALNSLEGSDIFHSLYSKQGIRVDDAYPIVTAG